MTDREEIDRLKREVEAPRLIYETQRQTLHAIIAAICGLLGLAIAVAAHLWSHWR